MPDGQYPEPQFRQRRPSRVDTSPYTSLPPKLRLALIPVFWLIAGCTGVSFFGLTVGTVPAMATYLPFLSFTPLVPILGLIVAVAMSLIVFKCLANMLVEDFLIIRATKRIVRDILSGAWIRAFFKGLILAVPLAAALGVLAYVAGMGWLVIALAALAGFFVAELGAKSFYVAFTLIAIFVSHSLVFEWFGKMQGVVALYGLGVPSPVLWAVAIVSAVGFALMTLNRGTRPITALLEGFNNYTKRDAFKVNYWGLQFLVVLGMAGALYLSVFVFPHAGIVVPLGIKIGMGVYLTLAVAVFAAPKIRSLLTSILEDIRRPSAFTGFEKVLYRVAETLDLVVASLALLIHSSGEGGVAGHGAFLETRSLTVGALTTFCELLADGLTDAASLKLQLSFGQHTQRMTLDVEEGASHPFYKFLEKFGSHDHHPGDHHDHNHGIPIFVTAMQFLLYVSNQDIQDRSVVYRHTPSRRYLYTQAEFLKNQDGGDWVGLQICAHSPPSEGDSRFVFMHHSDYIKVRRWQIIRYIGLSVIASIFVTLGMGLYLTSSAWLLALTALLTFMAARTYLYLVQKHWHDRPKDEAHPSGLHAWFAPIKGAVVAMARCTWDWLKKPSSYAGILLIVFSALAGFATGANGGIELMTILGLPPYAAIVIAACGIVIEGIFYRQNIEDFASTCERAHTPKPPAPTRSSSGERSTPEVTPSSSVRFTGFFLPSHWSNTLEVLTQNAKEADAHRASHAPAEIPCP